MADFGEIIDSTYVRSVRQDRVRTAGLSPIEYQGNPAIYHAGDVVNLPYVSGEISSIEAVGLAWSAYASGITPA